MASDFHLLVKNYLRKSWNIHFIRECDPNFIITIFDEKSKMFILNSKYYLFFDYDDKGEKPYKIITVNPNNKYVMYQFSHKTYDSLKIKYKCYLEKQLELQENVCY
jgi:hypothetical protein